MFSQHISVYQNFQVVMVSYSVGEPIVQEANVLKSKRYRCSKHLKIGHGHKESLNKGACVVTTMQILLL